MAAFWFVCFLTRMTAICKNQKRYIASSKKFLMLLFTKLLLGMCLKKTDPLKLQPESKTFLHFMLNSYRRSTRTWTLRYRIHKI